MQDPTNPRRRFLAASSSLLGTGWITLNWPGIAASADQAMQAAHATHAAHASPAAAGAAAAAFTTLTPAEAAEVDAIANRIIPGGATPGARDARVIHFIDRALGSFFAAELPAFRNGLAAFGQAFGAQESREVPFSQASEARQIAFLHEVDSTPFFNTVRRLTLLGFVALPSYGGNQGRVGWKLLGFEDRHIWEPPFGHYDADYPGFEPYPGTQPYGA